MATHQTFQVRDGGAEVLPGTVDANNGVLQSHGLRLYRLGHGDWYAYCPTHDCPSLVDGLDAALAAECPGCVAQREVDLRRLRLRLRVGAV